MLPLTEITNILTRRGRVQYHPQDSSVSAKTTYDTGKRATKSEFIISPVAATYCMYQDTKNGTVKHGFKSWHYKQQQPSLKARKIIWFCSSVALFLLSKGVSCYDYKRRIRLVECFITTRCSIWCRVKRSVWAIEVKQWSF